MTVEVAGASAEDERTPSVRLPSSLRTRNIWISGRRTSIRLEKPLWEALQGIADAQGCSVNELVSTIAARERSEGTLTSAIRVFIVEHRVS